MPLKNNEDRKAGVASMRVYFALWPDARVVASLQPWLADAQRCCGGRAMRDETLHMTLAFLGDIDAARVPALVAGTRERAIAPGTLALTGYGVFKKPGIVWAGPAEQVEGGEQVARINDDIWQWLAPLGFARAQSAFRPHVTLLRNADTSVLPARAPAAVTWEYDSYALILSEQDARGRHYRILARTRPCR